MSPQDDVRRYRLLASAVAGRGLDVAAAAPGSRTWTDAHTVFVDVELPAAQQVVAAVIQSALLGAGSFDRELMTALRRRPLLAARYLAVEAHRALALHDGLLPPVARPFVDRRSAQRSDSPADSLAIASSGHPVAVLPPVFGVIRPRDLKWVDRSDPADEKALHRPRSDRARPLSDFDDSANVASDALDISSPVGGGGSIGRLLRRLLIGQRSTGSAPPGADPATHRLRSTGGGRGLRVISIGRPVVLDDRQAVGRPTAFSYPEWDSRRGAYRPGWCTVNEVTPPVGPRGPVFAPNTHALRLPLAKVVLDLDRYRRQFQGDDIDLDACIAAQVELVSGGTPDESVYVDAVRRRRDLAVLVLLDVSGSAAEPATTTGSVHEKQRATAAALTFAFSDLGDRTALYAFRSMGRSDVQLVPVKRFEDRIGASVVARLGGLEPGAYTRLGAAIRHGARQLEEYGGTRRRLLVVLSDGFAYDHGYEGEYGEADARRALFEARRRGIGCLCLSVGVRTDAAALSRVFGTAAHAVVPEPEQLAPIARRLFHAALKSAEEQRRSA